MAVKTIEKTDEDGEVVGEVQVIDYGPFEIEVGSPTYERLRKQGKLPPGVEAEVGDPGLSALTVTDLRRRAKAAGIDHAGLSKTELVEALESAPDGDELE